MALADMNNGIDTVCLFTPPASVVDDRREFGGWFTELPARTHGLEFMQLIAPKLSCAWVGIRGPLRAHVSDSYRTTTYCFDAQYNSVSFLTSGRGFDPLQRGNLDCTYVPAGGLRT